MKHFLSLSPLVLPDPLASATLQPSRHARLVHIWARQGHLVSLHRH